MRNPEQKALGVLANALPPGIEITPGRRPDAADLTIRAKGQPSITVELKWAGAGFPRDVERALMTRSGSNFPLVIVAEALSPGSRHMLEERGIPWVSADGAANLVIGPIWVTKNPSSTPAPRETTGMNWTDSASTVAETMLSNATETGLDGDGGVLVPTVIELSADAFRSVGSVSSALAAFDREGWTRPMGARRGSSARRRLVAPGTMLDAWAARARAAHEVGLEYHSLIRDPFELARAVASEFDDVVFSGRLAADLFAPFSTELGRVRCYLPVGLPQRQTEDRLRRIGLTYAPNAGRLILLSAGPHLISQSRVVEELRLASPVRTYVDLLREPVRGEEAASHLRDAAIGF